MTKMPASFWWEFVYTKDHALTNKIKVESSSDDYPVVGIFEYASGVEEVLPEVDQLIADLRAGRKDPRKLYKELKEKGLL